MEKAALYGPDHMWTQTSVTLCAERMRVRPDATISPMPRLSFLPLTEPPAAAPARKRPEKFEVHVRASLIDGQGAFAAVGIPARRKIGEVRGEAISAQEAQRRAKGQSRIMIVAVSERRAVDASNSSDPLRYINHSCRPNACLRVQQGRVEFYAMRDVAAGEEITVNYGETHHRGRLQCRCGVPGCVGRL
jgi:SET domain-containing protein